MTIKDGVNGNTIYGNGGGKNTLTGSFNETNLVSGFGSADTENVAYEELAGGETKTITIGGKQYTVNNRTGVKTALLYTKVDIGSGKDKFISTSISLICSTLPLI